VPTLLLQGCLPQQHSPLQMQQLLQQTLAQQLQAAAAFSSVGEAQPSHWPAAGCLLVLLLLLLLLESRLLQQQLVLG
jgi:hypothetical protein